MAGGFFRGLVHGAAAAAVMIVAGWLVRPLSEPPADALPDPHPTAPEAQPAISAPALAEGGPALGTLDVPVGSEFGRSGDLPPRLPAPVSGTAALPAPAPAIAPPAAEPAPVAATGGSARPEAAPDPDAPLHGQPVPVADGPALDLPGAEGASPPDRPAAPQSTSRAPRDEAPVAPAPPNPAPVSPPTAGPLAEPVAIPRLYAPALDLSLPPDLSDLRRLERD